MSNYEAVGAVSVDVMNPGQFFGCCGLLELAHRLWGGAEGWFENQSFLLRAIDHNGGTLDELIRALAVVDFRQVDPKDDYSSPIEVLSPFNLMLDWWKDEEYGGKRLKVWAGSMRNLRIARAMQYALSKRNDDSSTLFSYHVVAFEKDRPDQKVEPFYFDSRRAAYAKSIDIGFMPDTLDMPTVAYAATELLCLIGLQRCRPAPTDLARVFKYFTWAIPLPCLVAPAASCGLLESVGATGFRFENAFRTGQKKHKCFQNSIPIGGQHER